MEFKNSIPPSFFNENETGLTCLNDLPFDNNLNIDQCTEIKYRMYYYYGSDITTAKWQHAGDFCEKCIHEYWYEDLFGTAVFIIEDQKEKCIVKDLSYNMGIWTDVNTLEPFASE